MTRAHPIVAVFVATLLGTLLPAYADPHFESLVAQSTTTDNASDLKAPVYSSGNRMPCCKAGHGQSPMAKASGGIAPLTYSIAVSPPTSHIAIGTSTGSISFGEHLPAGTHEMVVTVTDAAGARAASKPFHIVSYAPIPFSGPAWPTISVRQGEAKSVLPNVPAAGNGGNLMYEFLSTAPQGITINKTYGAIRIDETVPVGNYTVYARAKLYTYVHSGNPPPKVLVLKTSDEVAVSIVVEALPTK